MTGGQILNLDTLEIKFKLVKSPTSVATSDNLDNGIN